MHRFVLRALVACVLVSCSGEPFRYQPGAQAISDAGSVTRAPVPQSPVGTLPWPHVGFARRGSSEIVAFDPATGATFASQSLAGIILDLAWDPRGRLLALERDTTLEESRVRAFSFGAGGFVETAASEPIAPEARVAPFGAHTLLMAEDMGVSWTLLDDELKPVAPSHHAVRPSGLLFAGDALLALNPTLFEAGTYADQIVRARFDEAWQIETESVPAEGRPESRLARLDEDEALVVRKQSEESRFELARIGVTEASSPVAFVHLLIPGAIGSLEAVLVLGGRPVLVALLGRNQDPGALAFMGVDDRFPLGVVELDGAVEHSPWFTRRLVPSGGDRLLVDAGAGIRAYRLVGGTPALVVADGFSAPELAAPITGTW
jgi:hypothetical protein